MSEHWFLVDAVSVVGEVVDLGDEEARHAGGARRLRDGDRVVLFDGAGTVAEGALAERGRAVTVMAIDHQPRPACRLEIASAVPKGDRIATLLDMSTQLGMTAFIPLRTKHGVTEGGKKALRRWRRVCVEACKQSHRAWLPAVQEDPTTPGDAVNGAMAEGLLPVLADRFGASAKHLREALDACAGVRVLVGPEGGFDESEIQAMCDAGAISVGLAPHVLRIETAAVAACAMVGALLRN